MTYAVFLLALVVAPIVALALARPGQAASAGRALAIVAAAALVYTTPWDNYLVARGVWGYGPESVLAVIGYVPVEEYAFFVLQPLLVGLLFLRFRTPPDERRPPPLLRSAMVGGWLAVTAAGAVLLIVGSDDALYAGLILAWAGPALAGLSMLGSRHVWANRRACLAALGLASAYFWIIDLVAIGLGIWHIDPRYSLGTILGLPIEEALFFSITTWLCIQGMAMLLPEETPVPV